MTQGNAKLDALQKHPDCVHAEVYNGINLMFFSTWVIKLWRNEECCLANDPPKYTVQGYSTDATEARLVSEEKP